MHQARVQEEGIDESKLFTFIDLTIHNIMAQDVIEIMREALYDKFGGMDDLGAGCVDFRKTG